MNEQSFDPNTSPDGSKFVAGQGEEYDFTGSTTVPPLESGAAVQAPEVPAEPVVIQPGHEWYSEPSEMPTPRKAPTVEPVEDRWSTQPVEAPSIKWWE